MKALERFDWEAIQSSIDREGYASLPDLLCDAECEAVLESRALPLDALAMLYRRLVPIANRWNAQMRSGRPPFRRDQRVPATISTSRLSEGQHQPFAEDVDAPSIFPIRGTVLLSRPRGNFDGGELVMTEQRPRMQSRAIVVPLDIGGAAVFAGGHRPAQGKAGTYRVNMRHAVSRVTRGTRTALDFLFYRAS